MENKYCPPYLNKQIKHFVGGGNCGVHNGALVILWVPMLMTTITVLCGYTAA
jgi:hypothetical protein